tara:strand:- start:44 stop:553 length:510 start_codon:yes stop_codon:yes gene_type:complete
MSTKKLKNIVETSQATCRKNIQNLYVTSRLPLSDDAFVWTDWFPFGSQSFSQWIKSKQIGTYLFRHKKKGFFKSNKKEIYTGQGIVVSRVGDHKNKFNKGIKNVSPKWTFIYKLIRLDSNINNWEVCCCIIDTGNVSYDKEQAKTLEDSLMNDLDLIDNGLNEISGAIT